MRLSGDGIEDALEESATDVAWISVIGAEGRKRLVGRKPTEDFECRYVADARKISAAGIEHGPQLGLRRTIRLHGRCKVGAPIAGNGNRRHRDQDVRFGKSTKQIENLVQAGPGLIERLRDQR